MHVLSTRRIVASSGPRGAGHPHLHRSQDSTQSARRLARLRASRKESQEITVDYSMSMHHPAAGLSDEQIQRFQQDGEHLQASCLDHSSDLQA